LKGGKINMWASFLNYISLEGKEEERKVKRSVINKILNRLGYFKLSQLKAGGICGCCGKFDPEIIWVDYNDGDNWADIGICEKCLKGEK
jgi:hypothetical protein